ncbi:MAG: hypothetical protein RL625_1881 [Gemmatimonadota bacterium]|jgi:uncharacterized protein YuzE
MKVKYFKDTDTALLEFAESTVEETVEISDSVYVDLDRSGNLVSMTIEHASLVSQLPVLTLETI